VLSSYLPIDLLLIFKGKTMRNHTQVGVKAMSAQSHVTRDMFMAALLSGGLFITVFQALCLASNLLH
jgi:hypothetical protein